MDEARTSLVTRRSICLGLLSAILFGSTRAYAGSYLNRAALLLRQANAEADYVRLRLTDRELSRVAHEMALARSRAAAKMQVPPEVVQAHPHLLLVLEHFERALSAAVQRESERFISQVLLAREEERTFHAVLKQLGWKLPEKD